MQMGPAHRPRSATQTIGGKKKRGPWLQSQPSIDLDEGDVAALSAKSSRSTTVGICWELSIITISDAEENFQLELDLKYTWFALGWAEEYRAAGMPKRGTPAFRELVESCWAPLLYVNNAIDIPDDVSLHTICVDETTGQMHRYHRMRCTCSVNLDLHWFPFDRQWLEVQIGTFRDISEVVFAPYPGRPCLNSSRGSRRWHLMHRKAPMLVVPDPDSRGFRASSGRLYQKCYIAIEAVRDSWWCALDSRASERAAVCVLRASACQGAWEGAVVAARAALSRLERWLQLCAVAGWWLGAVAWPFLRLCLSLCPCLCLCLCLAVCAWLPVPGCPCLTVCA
jgi:hypothetical protein